MRAAINARGADGLLALFPDASPQYKSRLVANDINAPDACRCDCLGYAGILPTITMRRLVYAGTADPMYPLVEATVAEMPNATFFSLPPRHSEVNVHSELVLPHVRGVPRLSRLIPTPPAARAPGIDAA